ncbi:MAG: LLM class flavin-dependent oxidoreductase [Actinomycetota bacterium]
MMRPSVVVLGADLATLASLARRAEAAGFESAWATEFYDRSATISLASMAATTSTIGLGSGIAYGLGRSPLVLAAEARDLDELSDGRLVLGLGTGTRRMQADWHGLDPEHPAPKMEELVPLLRSLWALHESPVHHDGRFFRTHVEPIAAVAPPRRPTIPIYLAGVGRRMVEAAGRVGDGLVGHPLFTPEYAGEVVRPALARGAERGGRDPAVPIAGCVICAISDSPGRAREEVAAQIGFYSTVKSYDSIHRLHGFEGEVDAIRQAFFRQDAKAMTAAVSDRMLDAMAVFGTPEEARQRFAARFDGVYERPLLYSPSFGLEHSRLVENLDALVETFGAE